MAQQMVGDMILQRLEAQALGPWARMRRPDALDPVRAEIDGFAASAERWVFQWLLLLHTRPGNSRGAISGRPLRASYALSASSILGWWPAAATQQKTTVSRAGQAPGCAGHCDADRHALQ